MNYLLGSGYTKEEAIRASKAYKGSWIELDFENNDYKVLSEQDPKTMIFWVYQDTLNAQNNPVKDLNIETMIIETEDSLRSLMAKLNALDTLTAWDTETTGLDWQTSDLVGVGVCWGLDRTQSAYIPVFHWKGNNLDLDETIKIIKPFLEDPTKEKVFHNAKFDMHVFANYGIQVKGICFDTIVAHYLLKPDSYHALDIAIQEFYPCKVEKFEDVITKTKKLLKDKYKVADRPHINKVNISHAPIERVAEYCGVDVWSTLYLHKKLEEKLSKILDLENLFYSIEMPLISILFRMERKGLCLDYDWYKKTESSIKERRKRAIQFGKHTYGINIQSTAQVREHLISNYGVDPNYFNKTATGELCVDAPSLFFIAVEYFENKRLSGFINVILTNRKNVKMGSTYVSGVYNKISRKTGRLHTTYNQTRTETGRLSSSNPNSQNFPARGKYSKYRSGVIPEEGMSFLAADYSGCELRFLAHMSGCKAFINTFLHGMNGGDPHTTTAKLIFNLEREPTKEERFTGKIINFGTIYGMQHQKLSRTLKITEEEAVHLFDLFWDNLPEIKVFVDQSYKQAVCLGYTQTILGRRRYFEFSSEYLRSFKGKDWRNVEIKFDRVPSNDSESLRASANHIIQGSNADLTKKAMNKWSKILLPEDGYMSLTIHDEIISSVRISKVDHYKLLKKKCMESAMKLSVPLKVDLHIGTNWKELK